MAKGVKKVSINKLEKALYNESVVELELGESGILFQTKYSLTLSEMRSFVQNVVESCVDDESGDYVAEAYDFAIRVNALTLYANFTMPVDLEKQYWLVYNTPAFDQIKENINKRQFLDIIQTIDRLIKFRLEIITSSVASKINEVIAELNKVSEVASSAFNGISPDVMADAIQNITKVKDMQEDEIARALLGDDKNIKRKEKIIEIDRS